MRKLCGEASLRKFFLSQLPENSKQTPLFFVFLSYGETLSLTLHRVVVVTVMSATVQKVETITI
jgi:hypothetical protein